MDFHGIPARWSICVGSPGVRALERMNDQAG